jgi:hypothetical protein
MAKIKFLHGFMGKLMNRLNRHRLCLLSLICRLLLKGVGGMRIPFLRMRRHDGLQDGRLDVVLSIPMRILMMCDPDAETLGVKV